MKARMLGWALCAVAIFPLGMFNSGCKSRMALTDDPCKGQELSRRACQARIQSLKEQAEEQKKAVQEQDRLNGLAKGDPNTPDSQFVDLNSGNQLALLFYSLSGMPPDYEALTAAASEEYRSTSDEFRKPDLMQALRPKIDAQLAAYKDPRNRYMRIVIANSLPLRHYDFSTHSFPVSTELDPDHYSYFNDVSKYSVSYSNGSSFQKYPVADEQHAKELESLVTRNQTWGGRATAYLFMQAADTSNNRVNAQILHVVLEQSGHREVGRY